MHDNLQDIFSPNLLAIIVSIVIGLVYGLEREVDASSMQMSIHDFFLPLNLALFYRASLHHLYE